MEDNTNWNIVCYGVKLDGQFACKYCKGTKKLSLPIGSTNESDCWMCNGSGYHIDYVASQLMFEQLSHNSTRDDFKKLIDWVKATSKCTKCTGNSSNTIGGCLCEECGLEGTSPWGG